MAKRIVESFIDDIDGGDAEGTTTFALDGTTYEIDLSGKNREKLEKALAPFITKARAVRAERGGRGGRRGVAGSSSRAMSREKSTEIRRWARDNGLPVSERGRIAASVVKQYEAAH
ncbi:Lsr2 protein [Nonomuraea maritima]|uniref:Lsr2 protein n=1 Tax=Nonomuraea maritima TaxID=683260 RepID=A0A1G9H9N2_9ACTN|nr:Lsr2 family protein [Nonomuraea maritima]SDL09153.1 Lsr2 protein [Nonomuraea maritima]